MSAHTIHPSAADLAAYRQRTLAPERLLDVDDHLAVCPACRAQAADARGVAAAAEALAHGFASPERTDPAIDHVPPEQLAAFVDGELSGIPRESVGAHLESCDLCAADAADFAEARRARDAVPTRISAAAATHARGRRTRMLVLGGAAAAIVAAVVWSRAPSVAPPPESVAVESPAAAAPPRVSLNDSAGVVGVAADGRLQGLPALTEAETGAVRQALEDGRLGVPPAVLALGGGAGTLMSGSAGPQTFAVARPIATAVETDRPLFEWARLDGAASYTVSVFDEQFTPVVTSAAIDAAAWRPDTPLRRGRTYYWQVRARGPGVDVLAPAPPAPDARFRVLDAAEAARVVDLRRRAGQSHLVLGVLLAGAGLLDDAERELEQLAALNPGAEQPRALLADLRRQQR